MPKKEQKILMNQLMNEESRKKLLQVFDSLTGIKVSNAYRKYKKTAIENIRLIEYDVWDYIPSLVFTDSIRGASLAAVQKSIIESSK